MHSFNTKEGGLTEKSMDTEYYWWRMVPALKVILLKEKLQAKDKKHMNAEWSTQVDGLMASVKASDIVIMVEKIIQTYITKGIGAAT